ncbi:M4 family metallopeptidase [Tumebacillus permanentifrigoris]|uniref:Neutral metalloproteinase n=1 Tax=Tumebacillus permanentifrigoris TaxID=378543 RepID=A0A316D6U6_9BACL|nr:M4 family metallopeptidase [Tumebacillus permanentifrigoris]PWK11255.1 bacillolysin/thermolysin [Tumebacillus permanentifrigoris]
MNKKGISTLVLSSLFASVLMVGATDANALTEKKVLKNENGEIHTISGDLGTLRGATAQDRALDALNKVKVDYGIKDVSKEFKVKESHKGELSTSHTKFNRQLNGIPVFGDQLIVHEDNGRLTGVTGKYKALTPTATQATISKTDAEQKAVAKTGFTGLLSVPSNGVLTYFPSGDKAILTYKVNVCYLATDQPGDWTIFVNATDGSIVESYNSAADIVGTGTGVFNDTKKINTVKKGTQYYLEDRTKAMYVNGSTISTYTFNHGSLSQTYVTDADNNFNGEEQKAAVDAHFYAGKVYDFYKNVMGRNSYDNQGATIISGVHYSTGYNNAFWSSSMGQMVYGDGDGTEMVSLSGALDVIGHELTHAVTEYTSGLIYKNQSGALNESWSDALGVAIENKNWLVGEDIWTPAVDGDALRYMDTPSLGKQPEKMSQYVVTTKDNGGVHTNSGIPNKAFYLFATSLGSRVDAAKVWYAASRDYMTQTTDFSGARAATLLACQDLYGQGSTQYTALQAAWTAVEVN